MLDGQLDPDAMLAGDRQHRIDAPGAVEVVLAGLLVLDLVERVAQPDADVVAAAGLQFPQPCVECGEPVVRLPRPDPGGRDQVQSVGDIRLPVGGLEVTRIARTDLHEVHSRIAAPRLVNQTRCKDGKPREEEREGSHGKRLFQFSGQSGNDISSMLSPTRSPGKNPRFLMAPNTLSLKNIRAGMARTASPSA